MPNYGPGRTPLLGLAYSGEAGANANWDKIDGLLGKLATDAGLIPAPMTPAEEAAERERIAKIEQEERDRVAEEKAAAEKHAKAEEHHAKG